MSKQAFSFIFLISIIVGVTSTTYAPWHLNKFDYSVSDICSFRNYSTNFKYVKPCPKNYQCYEPNIDSHEIGVCLPYYKTVKTLGDSCVSNIECDSDLVCSSSPSTCVVDTLNNRAYKVQDRITREDRYYCQSPLVPKYISSIHTQDFYECVSKPNNMDQKCEDDSRTTQIEPEFNKICGKITIEQSSNGKTFTRKSTQMQEIGQADIEDFVEDERACQSGFALYFYANKKTKLAADESSGVYKMCVNLVEVITDNSGNCHSFKYKLKNGEEHNYVIGQMSFGSSSYSYDCENLMTKLDLFKRFVEKKKSISCTYDNKYLDEPFTCGKDELRELWAYYNAPEYYLLYKNEQSIYEYLIQSYYPDYTPQYSEPVDFSGYLSIKYLSLIILVLLL